MNRIPLYLALLIPACLPQFACNQQQLEQAQAATDAKTYTCRYLEFQDATDPRIAKGQELCRTDADVRKILAALAGDACEGEAAK